MGRLGALIGILTEGNPKIAEPYEARQFKSHSVRHSLLKDLSDCKGAGDKRMRAREAVNS